MIRKVGPSALLTLLLWLAPQVIGAQQQPRVVVAYVCSWTNERLPDPSLMTHVNYAFGHVKPTFDGVTIQNEPFLRRVVQLKEQNHSLKVLLSVGGWTSGNFSEMAASAELRRSFARDCRRIADEYGLDGIDIDWEYPTSSEAGISSSPADTENFTLLLRDLRTALGRGRLLTIATIADARYVDFRSCLRYLDFVNIMAYDVANPPKHHTTLFRSPISGRITVEEAVSAHIRAGVPPRKLTLGMPLYGRGDHSNPTLHRYVKTRQTDGRYTEQWDSIGRVPYLTGSDGTLVWAFDDSRSLAAKCQLIIDRGLLGGMYWECTEDNSQLDGMRTIAASLLHRGRGTPARRQALILLSNAQGASGHLARYARQYLEADSCDVDLLQADNSMAAIPFGRYHVVIADGSAMHRLPAAHREAFEHYVDEGQGSFVSLNPTPEGTSHERWPWYESFCDSLRTAPIAGSTVAVAGKQWPLLWTNSSKPAHNIHLLYAPELLLLSNLSYAREPIVSALRWALHEPRQPCCHAAAQQTSGREEAAVEK